METTDFGKDYVKVVPQPAEGNTLLEWNFITQYKKEGNLVACLIPALDISYTVKNVGEVETVSTSMINAFLDYWVKNYGLLQFSIELKKLGFKAEREAVVLQMIRNNKKVKAEFVNSNKAVDESYSNFSKISGGIAA